MIQSLLYTFGIACLPLVEQRLAIPLGYTVWDLSIWEAALAGTTGNILSVAAVLWLLPHATVCIGKYCSPVDRIIQKIFAKTRAKHSHKFETVGAIFLITFVMLPIPGSGGWSGALIAWLFGVKYKESMKLITIGILLGAIIISLLTVGAVESTLAISEAVSESR